MGGSNTSLASQVGDNVSVTHGGTDLAPSPLSDISDLERAASQSSTDDLSDATGASRTDIVQPKSRSRVHLNGVEVGRVAPAIGQDSTNVMGLFNVEARYRGDEDVMSAISTAVSVSPFARPVSRGLQAHATQRFVSTYGSFALRTSQEDADSSFSQRATIPASSSFSSESTSTTTANPFPNSALMSQSASLVARRSARASLLANELPSVPKVPSSPTSSSTRAPSPTSKSRPTSSSLRQDPRTARSRSGTRFGWRRT